MDDCVVTVYETILCLLLRHDVWELLATMQTIALPVNPYGSSLFQPGQLTEHRVVVV